MIIIDVRTPEEFETSHHPDAINHPVELMMNGTMPDVGYTEPITLYCRSGGRAGFAMQLMQQAGFTNVHNAGGLDDMNV